MQKFHSEFDSFGGYREDYYIDEDTGECAVKKSWDMDAVVRESNIAEKSEGTWDSYLSPNRNTFKIASLDNITVVRLRQEHGIDVFRLNEPEMNRRFMRWLNDPDNAHWRTTNRRIGVTGRMI